MLRVTCNQVVEIGDQNICQIFLLRILSNLNGISANNSYVGYNLST